MKTVAQMAMEILEKKGFRVQWYPDCELQVRGEVIGVDVVKLTVEDPSKIRKSPIFDDFDSEFENLLTEACIEEHEAGVNGITINWADKDVIIVFHWYC